MKLFKNPWIYGCIALMGLAIILELTSSKYIFTPKYFQEFSNGQLVKREYVDVTIENKFLFYASKALFAFSISGLISILITSFITERRHKEHKQEIEAMQQAVNADVFDSLFKTLVPEEIFSSIKNNIILNKLVRYNFQWIYDFSTEGNKIKIKQTLIYTLHNNTESDISDPMLATTTTPSPKVTERLKLITCVVDGKETSSYRSEGDHSPLPTTIDEYGNSRVTIPVCVPSKKSADMTIIWEQEYICCDSCSPNQDIFFTQYPIINGSLTINKPNNLIVRIFDAMSSHFIISTNEPDRLRYTLNGAVLPGQGFVVEFQRTEPPTA